MHEHRFFSGRGFGTGINTATRPCSDNDWRRASSSAANSRCQAASLRAHSLNVRRCFQSCSSVPKKGPRRRRSVSHIASTADDTQSPGWPGGRAASTAGAATSGTCVANSTSTGLFRCYRWLFDHRLHGCIFLQHWQNSNLLWPSLASIQAESETTTFQSRPALCWLAHQVASTIAASAQCHSCCSLGALFEKQHTLAKQRDSLSHLPVRPALCLQCTCQTFDHVSRHVSH